MTVIKKYRNKCGYQGRMTVVSLFRDKNKMAAPMDVLLVIN